MIQQISEHINDNTIIVCIGTDKSIGDCLGPLVGTMLIEKGYKYPVYGTIDEPIHALNIDSRLNEVYTKHPNASIIGIDACIGEEHEVGEIRIRNKPVQPGKGVGKQLPSVGGTSIVGIVASDFFFGSTIRLSFIMNMARNICDNLIKAQEVSV